MEASRSISVPFSRLSASARSARGARQALALAACAALYATSVIVLLTTHAGHGWGFVDLTIYRDGGAAAANGAALYALRFPGALAFTYPPFAALVFTGLALATIALARTLATGLGLALLPTMLFFALRLAPFPGWLSRKQTARVALPAAAFAIWLEPVWSTLRYGQIDLLLGALILYDLSRPDDSRWKGAWVGLAFALKLTPAIFTLYLLLTRRYRATAVSFAVFCASVAGGFLALPRASREYWGGAFLDPSRVGRIENTANQSLRGALARVLHTVDVETIWVGCAVLVGLAGIALAVAASRRGEEALGFSLCALTGLLVSPISWSHHWTLAVPALLLLVLTAHRRRSCAALLAAAGFLAVAASHVIWWVPVNRPPHSELHLTPAQLLYANAYVLLALGALTAAGRRWLTVRRADARLRTQTEFAPGRA